MEERLDRCKPNFNTICEIHGAVACKRNRVDVFYHLSVNITERQSARMSKKLEMTA